MHPADVVEYVEASFTELAQRLADRPGLTTEDPVLESLTLYVPFTLSESPLAPVPSGLFHPSGQPFSTSLGVVLGQKKTFPVLLTLDLTDYDSQPPTAELLQPDRTPLPAEQWPNSLNGQGVLNGGHPDFQRKWFCRPGLREYHTHPQHEDDPWDSHREGLALHTVVVNLLVDLKNRFIGQ